MKTPDEIKKALECCAFDECHGDRDKCPFSNSVTCIENMVEEALAYISQLEETIDLMKIQMRGDCGCCKHGRDGDMARCNECLSSREYHPLWEYEGLPEVKTDE